jgi:hypothetical protein
MKKGEENRVYYECSRKKMLPAQSMKPCMRKMYNDPNPIR